MITGSKFASGPPFCGALLVPADKAEQLRGMNLPPGFAAYAARHDWPQNCDSAFDQASFAPANLGMGLRWTAALSEIDVYARTEEPLRRSVAALFAEAARRCVAGNKNLDFLDPDSWRLGGEPATVFAIVTNQGDPDEARQIYEGLRISSGIFEQPEFSRVCHVGQPVVIAGRAALRICLSIAHVNFVAERLSQGMDPDDAFLPLRRQMELVFRKWGALAKQLSVPTRSATLA